MKKSILVAAIAFAIFSCNKAPEVKEVKTAYVDTAKLFDDYTEANDIKAKYKSKSEEMGRELNQEAKRFKDDAAYFQRNAQANGQEWAQKNGAALQERQQKLQYAEQELSRKLQQEMGVESDSMVSMVKKFVKSYGKENGYSYIYGTNESGSVLYAEDKYDITTQIVKLLNDKYKAPKPASTTATTNAQEAKK
jgi:outer membrane protein